MSAETTEPQLSEQTTDTASNEVEEPRDQNSIPEIQEIELFKYVGVAGQVRQIEQASN